MLKIPSIVFGEEELTIDDIYDVAKKRKSCQISSSSIFTDKISKGSQFLDDLLAKDGVIYGVTTGYGDSCTRAVPLEQAYELPIHLSRFHGCGLGNILEPEITRSVLAVRLASLCRGASGVSMDLINLLGYAVDARAY